MKVKRHPDGKFFAPAIAAIILLLAFTIPVSAQRGDASVFRADIKPNWLADGHRFWYRVQTGAQTHDFILVDAEIGTRQPAFDAPKLATALQKETGQPMRADNLPLNNLDFSGANILRFDVDGKIWRCNLDDYSLAPDMTPLAGENALRSLPAPHPSLRTGDETSLNLINRTTNEVEVFWIDPSGDRQPYGSIAANGEREMHTYAGHVWLVTTITGVQLAVFETPDNGGEAIIGGAQTIARENNFRGRGGRKPDNVTSPDGNWTAFVRDNNVFVRNEQNRNEFALSTNGTDGDFYGDDFHWSPDSKKLVATQTIKGEGRKVYLIESSPKDQLQPKLLSYDYNKPGDKIPIPRPRLFDLDAKKQVPVPDDLFTNAWSVDEIRWWPDSSRFTFLFNQRGHQHLRIISVDATNGVASAIVDEHSQTFIDYSGKEFSDYDDATHEIVWMSERDGWNHLYLYDAATGAVKNQITKGEWVVRAVDFVDQTNRQIWFRASGIVPGQDPYYIHYCRVNFDGTGLVVMTAGDGTHSVEFSPDRKYLVDSWSRVDAPPLTELRRSSDGKLICELEHADDSRLVRSGWQQPERFVAKGRDGVTDIYGVIFRPRNFDPKKKYPIVEDIYAGPQDSFTPKAFRTSYGQQETADLGFIVVQMDGMGTSNRSKKFHDVCFKNIADAGFPDRILWIKAAAAKHKEMDLSRIGIYGTSAGGQDAMRALLDHGDFYKVAVADCGCHDNRMDKIWWNEQWMGWPVDDSYARSSNVDDAYKLQGKLLLMVGELDHNVDPSSTMQIVNALEKAGKDFDMLIVTGADHGVVSTPYGKKRLQEYLVQNLLGNQPHS
jgi:dipeptidyl aminopeptidase/acylaminoacyl peptidase